MNLKKEHLLIKCYSQKLKKIILKTAYDCGEPVHLGGALSIVEIISVLYSNILNLKKKDSDRFILSKGHGFLALLGALHLNKYINKKELSTFQKNGSELIAHPIMNDSKGIESSNGSLGQGLSFGAGIAISFKKKKSTRKVYVLMGDGECYEGSVWEAAITCVENNLDNLIAIVDCNGFQNDGKVGDAMKFQNLYKKWKGFGWHAIKCDGHNIAKIIGSLNSRKKNKPTIIIAKTIKGKGISFMENKNDWHHGRLTKKIYKAAIQEI